MFETPLLEMQLEEGHALQSTWGSKGLFAGLSVSLWLRVLSPNGLQCITPPPPTHTHTHSGIQRGFEHLHRPRVLALQ
jgi:hypothetical protein